MTTRRHGLFLAVALLSALLSGGLPKAGSAAEPVAFDAKAFEAAQNEGRPILVQISAPWCPICRTQKPIVAALSAEPRFKALAVFTLDFDTQRDLVRRFGAQMQSTLILYKGRTEIARSVGETQPEWIEQLLEKAL
jgi:thiol-disulfide isomerase/thioredoxin